MYKAMAAISVLIRMFILPNPFGETAIGFIFNVTIGETLLHILSYSIVGIFYNRGDFSALGSFMYLVAYWGLVVAFQGLI